MSLRLAALLLLAATNGFASAARACTPVAPAPRSIEEQRRIDAERVRLAASPRLATLIAQAADISVAHVASQARAPLTDIPADYRDGVKWRGPALLPVRYVFTVDRVLKGRPGATLAFKPPAEMVEGFRTRYWTIKASAYADGQAAPTTTRDFWHDLTTTFAQSEGGPGDCSFQWSYRTRSAYLILRDAEQRFMAAIPLEASDALPAIVAQLVAAPHAPYPYRPDMPAYLRLDGSLLRVSLTDCGHEPKAKVLEVLKATRAPASPAERGEEISIYNAVPALDAATCRLGAEYVLDGWPYSGRLHPIDGQTVTFEDRWMQLRIAGDRRITLNALRAATVRRH